MKKLTDVFAAILSVCLLFTSCSSNNSGKSSGNNEIDGTLKYIHDYSYANSYGYYETGNPLSLHNASSMIYTDFESGKRIFMCSSANCRHNDDSCDSYLPGHVTILAPSDENIIFFGTYTQDNGDISDRIYVMDTDGKNKKLVYEFTMGKDGLEPFKGLARDDSNLYFIGAYIDEDDNRTEGLYKADTVNGGIECIVDFDKTLNIGNVSIEGVYEDKFICFGTFREDDSYEVFTLDVNGNITEDIPRTAFDPEEKTFYFNGDNMITISFSDKTFTQKNLKTGEEVTLSYDGIIPDSFHSTGIGKDQFIADKFIIGPVTHTNDERTKTETRTEYTYSVDFNSGEIKEITLDYYNEERSSTVDVLVKAEYGDKLLVISDVVVKEVRLEPGEKGITSMTRTEPQYAFISTEDYFASVPNYIPVENEVDIIYK